MGDAINDALKAQAECWTLLFEQLDRIEKKIDQLLSERLPQHVMALSDEEKELRLREMAARMGGEEQDHD